MDKENVTSNIPLVGLQNQLDTVRAEVISTNSGLQNIGRLIQSDNFEDQKKLIEERNQERLLAEREIRTIDEEQLKQKVDAAVAAPIKKLEPKLKSTLGSISLGLGSLFGVIKTSTITGITFAANLGIKSAKGIGNLVKNSLGAIASIFTFFSSGFSSVINSIGKVTSLVLGALGDLAKSPFKAISDAFKKFLPGNSKPGSPPSSPSSPSSSGLGALSGLFKTGMRVVGSVASGASAVEGIKENDPIQTGLGLFGVFNPVGSIASFGYDTLKDFNIFDMKSTQDAINSGSESIKGFLSSVGTNFNINNINFNNMKTTFSNIGKNISNSLSSLPFIQKEQSKQEDQSTQSNLESQSIPEPQPIKTVPFQAPPPSPPPSPEPEARPDLIYLGGNSNQQAPSTYDNSTTLTDVPLISSSNPNNFYTLYSQVNYNVLI